MNVSHISMEFYPAAKVGGLGDVVGALPKYLSDLDVKSTVFIPKYDLPFFHNHEFEQVFSSHVAMPHMQYKFSIDRLKDSNFSFEICTVNVPGIFDQGGVYSDHAGQYFQNGASRSILFQRAVLEYIIKTQKRVDILHCHDHHTGLIPFFVKYSWEYQSLSNTPTVFTIHNEQYQGAFPWHKQYLLPIFDSSNSGFLDWEDNINPLAVALKCAWKVTTVSPHHMNELMDNAGGLESLIRDEQAKCLGILNGIDVDVWDPKTDKYLPYLYKKSLSNFKSNNKKALCKTLGLDHKKPIVTFIGRLVTEKGADLLPSIIQTSLDKLEDVQWIILGSGQEYIENYLKALQGKYPDRYRALIKYDEALAHQLYASSDYIFMPSRVEPCGLNQMYAMRYGTIPIVHQIGGLADTVPDFDEKDGCGFNFKTLESFDILSGIIRAYRLFYKKSDYKKLSLKISNLDFSWLQSAQAYKNIYNELRQLSQ